MAYSDLLLFLCRTFRHTGRLLDLQNAWEALRLKKDVNFATFWSEFQQLRSDLMRTKDPVSDARAMARLTNAIAGNKALSSALRTTLIEGRALQDWTFDEYERTIKVLADVHHVPAPAPVHASSALAAIVQQHDLPAQVLEDLNALVGAHKANDKGKGKGKGKGKNKGKGKGGRHNNDN